MTPEQEAAIRAAGQRIVIERARERIRAQQPQERGVGRIIYDNVVGDPSDGVQSYGEQLGTWLNRAIESATLGVVGDEVNASLSGLLPGRSYESELDRYRQNEEGMSTAGRLSADIVGAVVPGLTGAGAVAAAPNILSGIGRGMATGAAAGGLYGFAEGEGGARARMAEGLEGAGAGAALGAAVPVAGRVIRGALQRGAEHRAVRAAARGAPSTEELRRQGQAAYRAVDEAGVTFRPDRFQAGLDEIVGGLRREGVGLAGAERVLPSSSAVADVLASVSDGQSVITWQQADMLRRYLGAASGANVTNRADTRLATQALGRFDDMIASLGLNDVEMGDLRTLQEMLPRAREAWSRMSRSQTIDDAIDASENYLSGTASGLRNQFRRILNSRELRRSFSDVEIRAMRRVVNGSIGQRLMNVIGGTLGQLGMIGAGATAGPVGAMLGAGAATAARRGAEASTLRRAELVRALVAAGGVRQPVRLSPALESMLDGLEGAATGAAMVPGSTELRTRLGPR